MADTFQCPTCGAPLSLSGETAATIRCPYCSNAVIVPETLRGGMPLPTIEDNTPDPARIQEIIAIARRGNKIEAIKQYRQLTDVGLKEAKDTVEALMEGRPVQITAMKVVQSGAGEDVAALVRGGKKIEAIKLYRQQTDVGLKEAKDAIDAIDAAQRWGNALADEGAIGQRSSIPTPPPVVEDDGSSRMVGCVTKVLVAIIVLAILLGCLTPVILWLFGGSGQSLLP